MQQHINFIQEPQDCQVHQVYRDRHITNHLRTQVFQVVTLQSIKP